MRVPSIPQAKVLLCIQIDGGQLSFQVQLLFPLPVVHGSAFVSGFAFQFCFYFALSALLTSSTHNVCALPSFCFPIQLSAPV